MRKREKREGNIAPLGRGTSMVVFARRDQMEERGVLSIVKL